MKTKSSMKSAASEMFLSDLRRAAAETLPGATPTGTRREGLRREMRAEGKGTARSVIRLVRWNGVLDWELSPPGGQPGQRLSPGRRAKALGLGAEVVDEIDFEALPQSEVWSWLASLDRKLTPNPGLRELSGDAFVNGARPRPKGRLLLLVHGTFSDSDVILRGLQSTDRGKAFLETARSGYDQVLAFDHPTVSVSPFLNALDLSRQFAGTDADIDVICHSRGGLVVRWWLDVLDRDRTQLRRAVFFGAPLAGTSLAAPPKLRRALGFLSNVGEAAAAGLTAVGGGVPLSIFITGLLKVAFSMVSFTSAVPIADAALAMIPGLGAQSRVGNNAELQKLLLAPVGPSRKYAIVTSNFEPTAVGWKFWKLFQKERLADVAADCLFDGPNDLVVDTPSMADFGKGQKIPKASRMDFGTNPTVHHLNYFVQPDAIEFVEGMFRK